MSDDLKPNKKIATRRFAWIAGILCVACCTVPLIVIAMGTATLAGLAVYSEKIAIAAAALGVATWLIYKRARNKQPPSCDLDCSCRPEKNG